MCGRYTKSTPIEAFSQLFRARPLPRDLSPRHNIARFDDRMPVIPAPVRYDLWLDPSVRDAGRLTPLLQPYPAEQMEAYPVSTGVGSQASEGPELIERAG